MELRAGTSGYSYKEWKGSFYPEKMPASGMLRFYAERLPAVEINNTFYRLPRASVLENWAGQVPDDFRFSLKASRRITHRKRLRDAGDETGYLFSTATALGAKLGAILFQLPPNLRADLPRLESFLDLLPAGVPVAFEFRHPSWLEDAVVDVLRARGASLCVSETEDDASGTAAPLVATGALAYVRLRRATYTDAELAAWAFRLREGGFERALVFFKHEDEGAGPALAARFLELAVPVRRAGRATAADSPLRTRVRGGSG